MPPCLRVKQAHALENDDASHGPGRGRRRACGDREPLREPRLRPGIQIPLAAQQRRVHDRRHLALREAVQGRRRLLPTGGQGFRGGLPCAAGGEGQRRAPLRHRQTGRRGLRCLCGQSREAAGRRAGAEARRARGPVPHRRGGRHLSRRRGRVPRGRGAEVRVHGSRVPLHARPVRPGSGRSLYHPGRAAGGLGCGAESPLQTAGSREPSRYIPGARCAGGVRRRGRPQARSHQRRLRPDRQGARAVTFDPDSLLASEVRASPNCEPRRGGPQPSILLLHYTGVPTCARAIDWLSRPESGVSCHYVVSEEGRVVQMVRESMRAWHAGLSRWAGEADINSASIGIEIHNPGHDGGYPEFSGAQMEAVEALCRDIVGRRRIRPERVLAHSDVAPVRKKDPGEKFDWARLARAGIGHWVEPEPISRGDRGIGMEHGGQLVVAVQELLASYGYDLEVNGDFDEKTYFVVMAFQRHFRPARVDGRIDQSTITTLERLIAALEAPSST
ncbi:MAG: N-acetylmuramoyl-L-alanine amidase [Hyphomicrobiaceae bacterium]|nr:N-acetylmuramoyl-L-alanine amidase [Hyphomicrobiaceae bacterium]